MSQYFDESKWRQAVTHSDWYLQIKLDCDRLTERANHSPGEKEAIKEAIRGFIEEQITERMIPFGGPNPRLDAERRPVDTIVIHHTSAPPGLSLARLNVIHLLNLYVPYYANPSQESERYLKGQPIASNHYRDGKQVFYAYHWLVRMEGSAERLLEDSAIGWQAGDWDVNCRSVAICLDNDYEDTVPHEKVLAAMAALIKEHYSQVPKDRILGHSEVNPKTICPGNHFLGGWKEALLKLL